MIGRLTGSVEQAGSDRETTILIDVHGVGYLAQVSIRTRARLPTPPELATLLIEMQIREDAITLYGFLDPAERDWFRNLTAVQGVGGKVALNLLSVLDPDELVRAVMAQDRTSLARAEGVGPKLAARLLTELKDKAAGWGVSAVVSQARNAAGKNARLEPAAGVGRTPSARDEAISALVNLGYRPAEASEAVTTAGRADETLPLGELIRAALRELGQSKENAR